MKIQQNLTNINRTIRSKRNIQYIVIHYTENKGDTAYGNTVYTEIHVAISSLVPDKEQDVIVYCSTGKRSSQAKYTLDYMGYKNVHYLGGIEL